MENSNMPRMDAYLASTVTPSLGTALFHMNRDIAFLEARHEEEIKRAVREAYEDAASLIACTPFTVEEFRELVGKLREKA